MSEQVSRLLVFFTAAQAGVTQASRPKWSLSDSGPSSYEEDYQLAV